MKMIICIAVMAALFLSSSAAAQMESNMTGSGQETAKNTMMMGTGSNMMSGGQQGMKSGGGTMMMPMRDMMPVMKMMKEMMLMQQTMMQGTGSMEQQKNMKKLSRMMAKVDAMITDMASKTQTETGQIAASENQKTKNNDKITPIVQEKAEAGVTVKITLENQSPWRFKTVLDTHSVALDKYDFREIVVLRINGTEYGAKVVSEEGSEHHRSAVLTFEAPQTRKVQIAVKNVAGIKERVFVFSLD